VNKEDLHITDSAYKWIKFHEKELISIVAGSAQIVSDNQPVTLFMAGSPGAGKTEISKRLVARFEQKPVRIDADEIRSQCPGYTGENAHLFQKAANKGVNILYDYARSHKLNVILDGTFAYAGYVENIQRSLDKGRIVEILFVYQEPLQAWDFTKKREATEKRKVHRDVFIDSFLKSRENANKAKEHFGNKVELNILIRNFEENTDTLELNKDKIDYYLKKVYTREDLEKIII
jgi:UDP-N-acetylglucosamine kinase